MALTEQQIVRYSRQILLKAVGGQGQEKLCADGAAITGKGSAQATAAAYLAAGGSPLSLSGRPAIAGEEGFLLDAADLGTGFRASAWPSITDANADLGKGEHQGTLGELPASFGGPPPWVALGWEGRRGTVMFRTENGCAACFVETAGRLSNGPSEASSVLLGALAALAFQRVSLGRSADLGGLTIDEDGTISPMAIVRCQRHAAETGA
jgi:molybdopterin-synthase adenylyltransferase